MGSVIDRRATFVRTSAFFGVPLLQLFSMKYILIPAFAFLVFVSCKKDDASPVFTLPAMTSEGLKTLGFELGTDVFVNYGSVCITADSCRPNTDAFYRRGDGLVMLQADKVVKRGSALISSETIAIYVETDHRGVFAYDSQKGDILSMAYYIEKSNRSGAYVLDPQNPRAIVTLTRIDTAAGILSGNFSAHLFQRDASGFSAVHADSVVVSNGRFDLKYK